MLSTQKRRPWSFAAMVRRSGQLRKVLADNVRTARRELGLSQEALADLAGLHRTFVGFVERAETNISLDNIEKIAMALGKDAALLLTRP